MNPAPSIVADRAARAPSMSGHAPDLPAGLQILSRAHPQRQSLERFIADGYARAYRAQLTHFADQLVGLRSVDGGWTAGVGFTPAGDGSLFVEQYLDRPVEQVIARRLGEPIERGQVVEVGNLAAAGAGAARDLILRMGALLRVLGRSWVVFTATRCLLNSFARLDVAPIVLAPADPARLPDAGRTWGSYYSTGPQVMTANIPLGLIRVASRFAPGLQA